MLIKFTYHPVLDKIVREVAMREIIKRIGRVLPQLYTALKQSIRDELYASTEVQSLLSGDLLGEMGLERGQVDGIVNTIINTLAEELEVQLFNNRLTISIGLATFERILALDEASYDSNGQHVIPWLDWLLIQGDRILVQDYFIKEGNYPSSRSGKAFMIENKGSWWRVPPEHQGVADDNFITRALNQIIPQLIKIIQRYIVNGI